VTIVSGDSVEPDNFLVRSPEARTDRGNSDMWQSRLARSAFVCIPLLTILLVFSLAPAIAQTASLPDEPVEQAVLQPAISAPATAEAASLAPNPEYAALSPTELDTWGKANFYFQRVMGMGTALGPAVEAAAVMAAPPKNYPSNWRQGAGGYGRNYGAVLGRAQTAELTRFVAGVVLREDPRYYPSANRAIPARILHAVWFTLVDRSDAGHLRPAFANLIGATAGGFVGNAYLPGDYTDLRHVGERTGFQMAGFAIENGFDEFVPELNKLVHALHIRSGRKTDSAQP
jgi:hypothetical protein